MFTRPENLGGLKKSRAIPFFSKFCGSLIINPPPKRHFQQRGSASVFGLSGAGARPIKGVLDLGL
jgi:hypothetical protein